MRSLKRDMALTTSIGAISLSVVAALAIYFLTDAILTQQFDDSLIRKARILASSIEVDHDELELGFRELDLSEFARDEAGGYLQVYLNDGRSFFRSPSLGEHDLPNQALSDDFSDVRQVMLPNGSLGHFVASRVMPIVDSSEQQVTSPVVLCVARDVAELQLPLNILRLVLIGVGLVFAVTMVLLTRLAIVRGLRSVDVLADRLGAIDEGLLDQPLDLPDLPRELKPILEQFNGLMSRLQIAFERERSFSADLAHELRTPLAGLQATLDVALRKTRNTEEYQQALRNVHEITDQMNVLVSALLHLAKLERGLVTPTYEPVDVDEVIRTTWRNLKHAQPASFVYREQITLDACDPVHTDISLLTLAIRNVLHNAQNYVDDGGTVTINSLKTEKAVQIRIANTGSRITAADVGKVFDRFWRADRARTDTGSRFGLGLALTRQAIDAVGGHIRAESQSAGEFVVTITLPDHDPDRINDHG